MWLPTTPYTQTLSYNQRVLINDEGRKVPIAWELSKVLDTIPIGITRLTFKQVQADMHADCAKYGIANLCNNADCDSCSIAEPIYIDAGLEMPTPEARKGRITYNGKDTKIRVGGSAKTLTAELWDGEEFVSYAPFWKIALKDGDNIVCSMSVHFNGSSWDISPDDTNFNAEVSNKGAYSEIKCLIDKKEVLNIKIESFGDSIKISCGQLYNMVGKQLFVTSRDEFGGNEAEITMEVIS